MNPDQQAIANFRKSLPNKKIGIKAIKTINEILEADGQEALVGRQFVGYDNDYARAMVYRIDDYAHNNGKSLLYISELTVHPRGRKVPFISLHLHTKDFEVSHARLDEVAKSLGLPTDQFHWYV